MASSAGIPGTSPPTRRANTPSYDYSDALGDWVDVPPDVEDAHAYAIHYAAERLNSRGDW